MILLEFFFLNNILIKVKLCGIVQTFTMSSRTGLKVDFQRSLYLFHDNYYIATFTNINEAQRNVN